MGNAPGGTSRRHSAYIESNIPPPDMPVEILSDGGSSGTTTPPVIIEMVTSGKEDSAVFVQRLNRRLAEEHKQIIEKIEADLEKSQLSISHRHSQDSQTEGDDSISVTSNPVTQTEIHHAEDRQKAVQKAEDVQKSLDKQVEEITALRTQMLGEYEQMLSVRSEVMASQSQEVEKLQQEMAKIQRQYETQMTEFQDKVQSQTEAALKETHDKELEDMKQYYETKVTEMEQSYTTDIGQLKQEHNELIARLQQENGVAEGVPSTQLPSGKHREYVHRTTTLTAISDEDETPPSSPSGGNEMLEGRIKILEEKLKDKEKLVAKLKQRFEAEATSAEDLHGKLLDSNKTLNDYEESLKSKGEEIEELKKTLSSKDVRITELESEKAALEERGEKEKPVINGDSEKIVKDLNERISKLEEELSASKETNAKIQVELNQLDEQHGEAIMKLKEEMENVTKVKLEEAETGFQIQVEEELKQQAEEMGNKYMEELEIYKRTESELKQRLNSVQLEHDKQLEELREKYETESLSGDKLIEPRIEAEEGVEVLAASSSIDRDSLEAAIRENVRAEILKEYEESIDKLKTEYEEKISEMNSRIQSYEAQDIEKAELADKEKLTGESSDSELRESLKSELAREFKDRLQDVTDEYETKLKKLQDIVDGRKEVKSPGAPYTLARSRSLDLMPQKEKEKPKTSTEYDGYVATIRKEYEDRINSLQMQIAQYRSTVGSVPSTPLSASLSASQKSPQVSSISGDSSEVSPSHVASESPKKVVGGPKDSQQEVSEEISSEYESSVQGLKENYDKQLEDVSQKLSDLQAEGGSQVIKDYEAIIEKLKQDYETQISELKGEHAKEVKELNNKLEKAQVDKLAAEQKVKADMFVWHEEILTQLKRKHEGDVTQLRKEYEEKMELYREELQEEFDAEKENIIQTHKREVADLDERYDNLVEGIRSGEVPEVAEMFQEKYDMELEMVKTLMQQECDETIESEQSRLSEEYEQQAQDTLIEKERELQELRTEHEKTLAEIKESLLLQYQSQTVELESAHQEAMHKMKAEYEVLLREKQTEGISKTESVDRKSLKSETSVDEDNEKEEEQEKVTSPDSTSDKSDKDSDGDDNDEGKGGAPAHPSSPSVDQSAGTDKHEQERKSDETGGDAVDEGDNTATGVEDKVEKESMTPVLASKPDSTASPTSNVSAESPVSEIFTSESSESLSAPKPDSTKPDKVSGELGEADSDLLEQFRHELAGQIAEYVATIAQLKASHEEEVRQLTEEIAENEAKYQGKLDELEETHEQDIKQYQDSIEKLRQGLGDMDDPEALDAAQEQELQDLEERLVQKHMNELNNLETQHQSKMDDMAEKHRAEIETLQQVLVEAQRAVEQYPDVVSPIQTVPTFQADSTLGSTKGSTDDFMVPTGHSQTDTDKSEPISEHRSDTAAGATMDTQKFDAHSVEDRSEEDVSHGGSLLGTLEEIGVQSLDTSMDQSRGTLRGVDTTQDTDLIEFYDEEESDKSMEEATETHKSDRSTPPALMQTLGYGADIPGGPTVKSLDDTTDSSYRASDKEELVSRIKELESEVYDLRQKLQGQINLQDDQMERLGREKQEENNLVDMLRGDVDRLNTDRDALQTTNEHLLGLLSDAVKTYMSVEDTITKKMKGMMEKSAGDKLGDMGHPGSAERKRTPPPGRRSPGVSPGRLSPARAEDGEGAQDTSIVSNITDEGLDLSQRFTDSIFQGPDLASEEEELLMDSGGRLRTSVNHLLDMIEESTSQLIETRHTHTDMLDAIEGKGHDFEHLTSRCSDLEERLKEEVERKDFLALELHKAEGLIEGYSSERETLDEKIQELNEQKETLVLELETTRNKLHDLQSMQTENEKLKKEMEEQRQLMTHNVGEEAQALMLEVTRLNSENREKEEQFKHVQDRYESRVRELETSGEDMESHYGKIFDEKKQEVADLKLHLEALEKQLKAKKQFLEEQSTEREQEHEEYQRELGKWKKIVQDLEKQNGAGSRLQREIDDLSEQLQNRIDLHNQALLESEKYQHDSRDKDISIVELKTVIQQLELDIQDKIQQLEQSKQKLKKLEEELSRRPYPDDDMSDAGKSGTQSPKSGSSLEFDGTADQKKERTAPQMTVEEEMRQAANKTKEELVREKFTLQSQVNENLVQISSLRNQLDDMRHRRGLSVDIPEVSKRLELEREKSEEKDKEISDLKLRLEELDEKVDNREQQIEQLREQRDRGRHSRGSPVEGIEFESDREMEKQMEAMRRETKQLRERVKLSETSSVTDISGLSQNLLEEKNQEIDHLAEQILRLQSDYNDLKAEKGVQNMCDEMEDLRDELQRKEKELADVQNVRVSQAFTDHSLTPDSSLLNVGASFSEKASIQQEMQDSVANGLEKMAALETEVSSMKETLQLKEEQNISLEAELSSLREDLQGKDEMILAMQVNPMPEADLIQGMPEDTGLLQSMIQEKEEMVIQLTVQVDSLQSEVDNLSDFQNKLQEDFDIVQTMLEEKDREIESLTKELTDRSPTQSDDHSLVVTEKYKDVSESAPAEVAKLRKQLHASQDELEKVKKSLNEAVDMSEQQLQMVEDKDQEYVTLKLDIQQSLAEKDKTIREQKNKIKEKEQELAKTKQAVAKMKQEAHKAKEEVKEKEEDLVKARREVESRADSIASEEEVATMRARLQNQEEVIVSLRSDLTNSQSTIGEQQKEIDIIQESRKQSKDNEAVTIQAMHNQMAELQEELQELRSAAKAQGQSEGSRSQDADSREATPYDQNGCHVAGGEPGIHGNRLQDSSVGTRQRSPMGMISQGDLTTEQTSRLTFDDQEDSGHQSFDPLGRDPQFSPEGQSLSPRQLRPFVAETVQEDMVRKDTSKSHTSVSGSHQSIIQDSFKQPYSPPTRDSTTSHSSGKSDDQSEGHRSTNAQTQSGGEPKRRHSPPVDSEDNRSVHSQSSHGSQRHARGDGDVEQRSPRERQAAGSTYTIDEERQVYQPRPDNGERSASESNLSYDRDDNIRPRYSHSVEAASGEAQRTADVDPARSSGEGQGMSSEAERYIQQLRRELLITKTALMQIQRGERLDEDSATLDDGVAMETEETTMSDRGQGDITYQTDTSRHDGDDATYDPIPSEENLNRLKKKLEKAEEELNLYRSSTNLSARDFVQKVMNLKDELSNEHQRHIQEMSTRAHQDSETQLATMRIKYTDEIDHIKKLHTREVEEKMRDQKQKIERKHKSEVNKMAVKHQEEVGALKLKAGADFDDTSVFEREQRQRHEGVGADRSFSNGHGNTPMSEKLQNIMRRLHNEGVQVLTISELEYLNRSQSQPLPQDADIDSMKAGWENERQTMLSTMQSLKDLLSQTHKLRGLDKNLEGSDWRAELLRCIGYVFNKERDTLLAELRSHVLSHPSSNVDEIQRIEQKIRTMESHHHAALDQIFNADRQSMLAEIRDLRAHTTISRMHQQEDKDRMNEKITNAEDQALKKERQLKREVQLLEFKIQQEKVLHEDLRLSLDSERNRSGDLSGLLNQEKTVNLDLQTSVSALQSQVSKLREGLEREQSRYVSVTNALEEEKSKSLNLSDLLESERDTLHRVQAELETLKARQNVTDPRVINDLQYELNNERERRCQADSQHEIDMVTLNNLQQEIEMGKRRQHAIETELNAKFSQLQRSYDSEIQKQSEMNRALDREKVLSSHLQQSLEAEQTHSERANSRNSSSLEDLQIQLETERANLSDLNCALSREQKARDEAISEKNLIKDHLNQERALNEDLKHDLDKVQFERLEAVNKLQKERDLVSRIKTERDQLGEDLRKMKSVEIQRGHEREEDRLSNKKSVREAERVREEYRMKLHEQELETQRLTQKVCGLEDQLAESQENELKAIREFEHLKIDSLPPTDNREMVSDGRSPRPDMSDGSSLDQPENPENWQVYRSQLDSMCQSLHYLILRGREQLNKVSFGGGARQLDISDFDNLQRSLRDLLSEVKQLQEMEGDFMTHPSGSVNERILRQNEELTNFIARISEEKTELRNALTRLEEEIWRYRQMDAKYQDMQRRSNGSEHQIVAERAEWAREKLSLQMALNTAEREIGLLQTDLRVERERRVAAGITETKDNDKIKIQRLYGKYLRAESFRKALIYQKKYLLLLLGGFQDTEETTLVLLSRMGAVDSRNSTYRQRTKPLTTFRGAVRVVIAIQRMKFLVKKWRRATRVGSEVVGGTVDQSNGYVPNTNSYSPPRNGAPSRTTSIPVRSSSSPPVWSSHRSQSPAPRDRLVLASPRFDADTYSSSSYTSPRPANLTHVPSTPPTKDYNSTTKYTSPSSGARRKILTSTSIPAPKPSHVRFTADESKNGGSDLGDDDDYIHRLESLQSRLGTLQNGKRSGYRQAWR